MKRNSILVACVFSSLAAYADEQPSEEVKVEVMPTYEHRINFDLLRVGYEHIKPDAVYAATECWYLLRSTSDGPRLGLGEAEARVGYNISLNPSNMLTPFIGGGYFRSFEPDKKQELVYPALGLRYNHMFGSVFELGLNLEGMMGYSLKEYKYPSWGNPTWGLDVGLPFTWKFTQNKRWDIRLEPFFTGWFGQDRDAFFGGIRSSFGYRF